MKKSNVEKKATVKQIETVLKSESTKSQKMKDLFELGLEIKEIQTQMNTIEGNDISFNFVYNVISNYVNMNRITVEKKEKSGKKEQIIEMYKQGKSNKEIQIELQTNYNYVFNVLKQYKSTLPQGETHVQ